MQILSLNLVPVLCAIESPMFVLETALLSTWMRDEYLMLAFAGVFFRLSGSSAPCPTTTLS